MRWRPEATTTTGSPSITKTIDFAIWPGSQPIAAAASATVLVDSLRVFSSTSSPSSRAASLTLERISRPCRRYWSDPYTSEGNAGSLGKLFQRRGQVVGNVLQVGHGVEVTDQAEVDRAVVAHQREPETLVHRERHHREHVEHLVALDVQRELRSGHVRHDEVERALAGADACRLREDRGRREAADARQHLGADGLA